MEKSSPTEANYIITVETRVPSPPSGWPKPGEIPVKLMVFLWISNSEAEQKWIPKKLTGDHVILI